MFRINHMPMQNNRHYQAIAEYYADACARRSGAPMIRHIQEGIQVLAALGSTTRAKEAFCIHPMLQDDAVLSMSFTPGSVFLKCVPAPEVVVLAMEYRAVANAYLSRHYTGPEDHIALSTLSEVNEMLIADKVQNRKDFEKYHLGVHEKSERLSGYFDNWLRRLGVSEPRYQELAAMLAASA